MFENCTDIRGLFSRYLDGYCEPQEMKSIRYHLRYCHPCAQELEKYQSVQADLRSLPRRRIPPELSLALRVRLSQRLHNNWFGCWRIHIENFLKPLLIPTSGGVLAATICFALLLGSNFIPPVHRPDVPLGLVTPPRLLELPPINFNTDDDQLVVMTRVNAAGQVTGYEVVSGHVSPELMDSLDRLIYFSVFEPATTFGTPTNGKVFLSVSRITVRG